MNNTYSSAWNGAHRVLVERLLVTLICFCIKVHTVRKRNNLAWNHFVFFFFDGPCPAGVAAGFAAPSSADGQPAAVASLARVLGIVQVDQLPVGRSVARRLCVQHVATQELARHRHKQSRAPTGQCSSRLWFSVLVSAARSSHWKPFQRRLTRHHNHTCVVLFLYYGSSLCDSSVTLHFGKNRFTFSIHAKLAINLTFTRLGYTISMHLILSFFISLFFWNCQPIDIE